MGTILSLSFEMFTVALSGESSLSTVSASYHILQRDLTTNFSHRAVTSVHQSEFHFAERPSEDSPLEMGTTLHHPGQPFAHVDGETQDTTTYIEKSYPHEFRARGESVGTQGTRVASNQNSFSQMKQ